MRVCFDGPVVASILLVEDGCETSLFVYDLVQVLQWESCMSAHQVPQLCCALRVALAEAKSGSESPEEEVLVAEVDESRYENLRALTGKMFSMLPCGAAEVKSVLGCRLGREDQAMVAAAACSAGATVVITYDTSCFAGMPVSAMTPREFLGRYKPANLDYSLARIASGAVWV